MPSEVKIDVNPTLEALKEPARYFVLGVVSYLLTEGIINTLVNAIFGTRLDVSVKLIIAGLLLEGLRGIDKFMHEKYKIENIEKKGLLPF